MEGPVLLHLLLHSYRHRCRTGGPGLARCTLLPCRLHSLVNKQHNNHEAAEPVCVYLPCHCVSAPCLQLAPCLAGLSQTALDPDVEPAATVEAKLLLRCLSALLRKHALLLPDLSLTLIELLLAGCSASRWVCCMLLLRLWDWQSPQTCSTYCCAGPTACYLRVNGTPCSWPLSWFCSSESRITDKWLSHSLMGLVWETWCLGRPLTPS